MPKAKVPLEIEISQEQARRFLLSHHYLWPPRQLKGRDGVLQYLERVGCIQFDPINVVGRNPDLVLQARVSNYRPQLLEDLLYKERILVDGWDKLAAIHPTKDWPHFSRFRMDLQKRFESNKSAAPIHKVLDLVRDAIRERGPLSSIEIEHAEQLQWDWGFPVRAVRAAMDMLYSMGELGVHHRVNTRRVFDLTENLIPRKIRQRQDPHATTADYEDWHVLRRIGGLGLAHTGSGESWLGISGSSSTMATRRNAAIKRLVESGKAMRVHVKGLPKEPYFIRTADLPTLESAGRGRQPQPKAAILGSLDNFMWSRKTLSRLFNFNYTWEVYVPEEKRKYGYYVLPVLYGDRFVARFDPAFHKPSRVLTIQNWWWEKGVDKKDKALRAAVHAGMQAFYKYLNTQKVILGDAVKKDRLLKEILRD